MEFEPKSYQQPAIDFIKNTPRCAIHAGIGAGKTIIALTAIDDLWHGLAIERALIIAPLNVVLNTIPDETRLWSHTKELQYDVLHGAGWESKLTGDAPVHVINYEGLKKLLRSPNRPFYDMVVLDECHWTKDFKTARFRLLRTFLEHVPRIVLMSGTPIGNSLMDLWAQYFLLDRGKRLLRTFQHFRGMYFYQDDYLGYKFEPHDWAEVAIINKVQDITFQVHADDVKLTKLTEQHLYCTLSDQVMEQYREFERNYFLQINEAEIEAFNAVTLSSKLRQLANGFLYWGDTNVHRRQCVRVHDDKFKTLQEFVRHARQNIMVVCTFLEDFEELERTFPNTPSVYSRTTVANRRKMFKAWNDNKIPLMAIHPRSVGTGLNLQHGGSLQVWLSPDWSYLSKNQTVGRIHRTGQTEDVDIKIIVAKNTIDEMIIDSLADKTRTTESFAKKLRLYRKAVLEGMI